jgi:hypothetical protein
MLRSTPRLTLAAIIALALNAACAKKIKVNGQDVAANKNKMGQAPTGAVSETPEPPADSPRLEVEDGLGSDRTHFQSRSTIVLAVGSEAAQAGEEISLVNQTTEQVLVDREPLSLDLAGPLLPGYGLVSSTRGTQLRLYLMSPELDAKLAYGENELVLTVDGEAPRTAKHRIVLRDFSAGAVQTLHFDGNRQRAGKLQGEISTLTKPSTRGSKSRLTTGFVPMINH